LPRWSGREAPAGSVSACEAPEQRGDARQQVRQADVLGQVIVGAEPQPGDRVEVAVARGQEDQRQARRAGAQLPAQLEAALGLRAEADVDDDEIGQARVEGVERLAPPPEGADPVTGAPERVGVVLADGGLVLDDGDVLAHGQRVPLARIRHILSEHRPDPARGAPGAGTVMAAWTHSTGARR
jgi:hypothetical protein